MFGDRVDGMAAYRRARQGMGRAFQNARSFGGLTVRETVMVALEARAAIVADPVAARAAAVADRWSARKRKQADEIIGYLGLGRYADNLLSELSTGTRRIVELGCLIALDAQLILLDEPTAGVAQKETEAFGPLIKTIQQELGSSILIIEHDMPMVMSISDRIYCLEAGAVIAEGTPRRGAATTRRSSRRTSAPTSGPSSAPAPVPRSCPTARGHGSTRARPGTGAGTHELSGRRLTRSPHAVVTRDRMTPC